jgi:hypothetical protein
MKKQVNLSSPKYSTEWLRAMKPSLRYGLSFRENLSLDRKTLGFSFRSNSYGLKGPDNVHSDTIICGTSYGLGIGVDEGANWYDLNDCISDYFNISFPVGTQNHLNRLEDLYKGNHKNIIYIYHPNLWVTSLGFRDADQAGMDVFSFKKWKTDWFSTLKLKLMHPIKMIVRLKRKNIRLIKLLKVFQVNTRYSYINKIKYSKFISSEINLLSKLFKKFDNVLILRVPIKEQLIPKKYSCSKLKELNNNYDELWGGFVKEILKDNTQNINISDLTDKFDLSHYHPFDTHWNAKGNELFYELFNDENIRSTKFSKF